MSGHGPTAALRLNEVTPTLESRAAPEGLPMAIPLAYWRNVPPPRKDPILGDTPWSSIASSQCRKRRQVRARATHHRLAVSTP